MFGSWTDSNGVGGTFNGTRSFATPTPGPLNPNIDPATGKRKTATRILCNRGPQPGDDFVCTATVGAFDGGPPNPSGTVKFSAEEGGFRFGDTCLLTPASLGNTSSCRVTYVNPTISAGTVVPVDAEYQSDTIYAKSSSTRIKSTVVRLPKKPLVCFSEVPDACQGLNAIIPPAISPNEIGSVTTSYFGPQSPTKSAARLAATAEQLTAPKRKGSVALNVQFIIKKSDNSTLSSLDAAKPFAKKLKSGFVIGSFKTSLKFGETKTTLVKLKPSAKALLAGASAAQLSSLKVQVKVESIRKGDTKSKVVTKKTNTALQP